VTIEASARFELPEAELEIEVDKLEFNDTNYWLIVEKLIF
jgi:hypothetical protein